MERMKMKKLLLGLGAASLAILPLAALVSCSDSAKANSNLKEREYAVKQNKRSRELGYEHVLDPSLNTNAQQIVDQLFNGLTVAGLQKDFDLILTDFYDIFEFENSTMEIELERIRVKSVNATARTALLEVTYESEEDDKEGVITKDITWKITPAVSSQAQIQQIKTMIENASTTNPGIDIKDLKEYFLGENDDDMDFDDFGVFDRIAKLNSDKDLNNLGGLVGYELKLSDIFSELIPTTQRNVTMDTVFFAPSAGLNNTFLFPSETGKLDYELDLTTLATITEAQIITYTTKEDLRSIIANKSQTQLDTVDGITIERLGDLLKVTVNFIDTNTPSEVISINPGLLLNRTP
ncbi:MAG: hypothetical protein ACRC7B_00390 [Metamycoplasmataceae bacterium]